MPSYRVSIIAAVVPLLVVAIPPQDIFGRHTCSLITGMHPGIDYLTWHMTVREGGSRLYDIRYLYYWEHMWAVRDINDFLPNGVLSHSVHFEYKHNEHEMFELNHPYNSSSLNST